MSENSRGVTPLAIIVMGVAGSGKSTLGSLLAHAIACPFLEGDDFHAPEAIAKMRSGEPLTDEDRWPWLDRIGADLRLAVGSSGVAVAACSALKRAYRDRLRQAIGFAVQFVLLEAGRDELRRRLTDRTGHYMPAGLLASQIDALEPPERDEPVIRLDAQQPPDVLCEQVLHALAQMPKA
jgi:gluconokinase